jgi:hypothetical protein
MYMHVYVCENLHISASTHVHIHTHTHTRTQHNTQANPVGSSTFQRLLGEDIPSAVSQSAILQTAQNNAGERRLAGRIIGQSSLLSDPSRGHLYSSLDQSSAERLVEEQERGRQATKEAGQKLGKALDKAQEQTQMRERIFAAQLELGFPI